MMKRATARNCGNGGMSVIYHQLLLYILQPLLSRQSLSSTCTVPLSTRTTRRVHVQPGEYMYSLAEYMYSASLAEYMYSPAEYMVQPRRVYVHTLPSTYTKSDNFSWTVAHDYAQNSANF